MEQSSLSCRMRSNLRIAARFRLRSLMSFGKRSSHQEVDDDRRSRRSDHDRRRPPPVIGEKRKTVVLQKAFMGTPRLKFPTNSKRDSLPNKETTLILYYTTNDQGDDGEKQVAGSLQKLQCLLQRSRGSIAHRYFIWPPGTQCRFAPTRAIFHSRPTNLPLTDGALLNFERFWRRLVELRARKNVQQGLSS